MTQPQITSSTPLPVTHPASTAPSDVAGAGADAPASAESQQRALKRRRNWVRECAFVAVSYCVNGVLLMLFALTDTAPWEAGLLYAGPGTVLCAVVAWFIHTGRTARFDDPSLSNVQSMGSTALCLLGVALFPQLAFAYALSLFTVVLTATYRMTRREVQTMLLVVVVLYAALTLGLGHRLHVPSDGPGERLLSWTFFIVTLARCVMLSVINTYNNRLLRERGAQMKAKLAEIERLAHHDELTGVLNRRRLLHILGEELARQDRHHAPVSVALLDLDHFKAVNDTLGHLAGDEVLKRFASAVQAHTRATDRFGRYGGEEFLVILTGAGTDAALLAIERTRDAVAALRWDDVSPELRVTFSAGIATYNGCETAEVLLSRADLGLYEAKRCGRNCSRAL